MPHTLYFLLFKKSKQLNGNVNLFIRQAEFDTQIPEFDTQIPEFYTQILEFDTWIRQESKLAPLSNTVDD